MFACFDWIFRTPSILPSLKIKLVPPCSLSTLTLHCWMSQVGWTWVTAFPLSEPWFVWSTSLSAYHRWTAANAWRYLNMYNPCVEYTLYILWWTKKADISICFEPKCDIYIYMCVWHDSTRELICLTFVDLQPKMYGNVSLDHSATSCTCTSVTPSVDSLNVCFAVSRCRTVRKMSQRTEVILEPRSHRCMKPRYTKKRWASPCTEDFSHEHLQPRVG